MRKRNAHQRRNLASVLQQLEIPPPRRFLPSWIEPASHEPSRTMRHCTVSMVGKDGEQHALQTDASSLMQAAYA